MKLLSILSGAALISYAAASPIGVDIQGILNGPSPQNTPIKGDSPVQLCDESDPQILTIDHVNLSPNPPKKGEKLVIEASGIFSKEVDTGSYVDIDVRYGYIKLVQETFDLCEQLENVDLTCPLDKGKLVITKEVDIPNEVPPGVYTVFARAYTPGDELITCLAATVEFPYAF